LLAVSALLAFTAMRAIPTAAETSRLQAAPPADVAVQALTAGQYHTCALLSGGGVRCWGFNSSGQLGDGTVTTSATPVNVTGLSSGVQAITAGSNHTCALLNGGGVMCWGFNSSGQLGDSTTTSRGSPVNVIGLSSGVLAVTAGDNHTCAVTNGGGVKCWGSNDYGQLGDSTVAQRTTPVDVAGLGGPVQAITAGGYHSCALTGGGVQCWGFNGDGELGDGTTTNRMTPVSVNGLSSGVQAISAGSNHTCALRGGGVQCWGFNGQGQLGDGTFTPRLIPVAVSGLSSGIQAIAAGALHSCALLSGGGVMCWGANTFGQLGDGSSNQRTVPVNVIGLSPDANRNGVTNSTDALCILRQLGGFAPNANCPNPLPFGDVNGRDGVTSVDALCVLRYLGGFARVASCPYDPPAQAAAAQPAASSLRP